MDRTIEEKNRLPGELGRTDRKWPIHPLRFYPPMKRVEGRDKCRNEKNVVTL